MKTYLLILAIWSVVSVSSTFAEAFSLPPTATIMVSGWCFDSPITMSQGSNINGKVSYSAVGTVTGTAGVTVNVSWVTSDNVWVLDCDGQPYYSTSTVSTLPPATLRALGLLCLLRVALRVLCHLRGMGLCLLSCG